jgi:glutaredoxin
MRCEEHGLAAGPSGQCVVCLREGRTREQRQVLRLGMGFVASVLAVCGAVLAFRLFLTPAIAARVEQASAPAVVSAEPAPTAHVSTSEAVQAAYKSTPVLMFSTTWCPHCNRARQFFQTNGLSIVDRDVDSDPSANAELKRRIGRSSIPLIVVDGEQLEPGFSEQATMQAIAASVQRRTGVVTGVRLPPASAAN